MEFRTNSSFRVLTLGPILTAVVPAPRPLRFRSSLRWPQLSESKLLSEFEDP